MTLEQLLSSTKRRLGAAVIGTALSLGALGSQIIPYLDQDAKVTALNASPQTITITATYAPYGHDPRNGTPETLTLAPGQSGTLANPLTQEGSAYVTSTGDDAVLTATTQHSDGSGMDIPVLDANAKNNGQPQAGILANGMQWEKEIVLSGDSTSNNTLNHQAYGPDGSGPSNAPPAYAPPGMITTGYVGDIYQLGFPAGSSDILIPQTSDQSKAGGLLLYTSPASGDTRIRTMQNFSTTQPTVQDFCDYWFPSGNFYGRVTEAYGIFNDSQDLQDISTILVRSPDNTNGTTVDQMEAWLLSYVDGDPSNGEITTIHSPVEINTTSYILFVNNGGIAEIHLNSSDIQAMRDLYRTQALPGYVDTHKPEYNCQGLDAIDMTCPPHWDTMQTTSSPAKGDWSTTPMLGYSTPSVSTPFRK